MKYERQGSSIERKATADLTGAGDDEEGVA